MRNRQSNKTLARWIQSRRAQTQLSDERGQAIVLIAFAMIGLVAFAGLVFDGGTAFAERRRMQNAAEAGALSGAYEIAFGGSNVTNQMVWDAIGRFVNNPNGQPRYGGQVVNYEAYYIDDHGVRGVSVKENPGQGLANNAKGVEVIPQTTFNTFFMNVVGMPVGTVSASAKAVFGPDNNIRNNVWPLAPFCDTTKAYCGYTPDGVTRYDLWSGGGPGNFGWLNWPNTTSDPNCSGGGTGVPELCNDVLHPDTMNYTNPLNPLDHTLSINDTVSGQTGVKNASKLDAVLRTLVDSKTIITVPIWDVSAGSGNNLTYTILGFASFILVGYNLPQGGGGGGGTSYGDTTGCLNNTGDCIRGTFVTFAKTNSVGDLCSVVYGCTSPDTGTRTIGLLPP